MACPISKASTLNLATFTNNTTGPLGLQPQFIKILFEPVHVISNNVVCATIKASDQPSHSRSLIRAFASLLNIL